MQILKVSEEAITKAVSALKRGEVVIVPTDTVYGFLADAKNEAAVEAVYNAKRRSRSKPLPLFIKNLGMAKVVASISKDQEEIIKKYWPGPYTFILRKTQRLKLFGLDKDTVALRMPGHPVVSAILRQINRPLVQTSVNIADQESINSVAEITRLFGKNPEIGVFIDGGDIENGKSSQIMDITSNSIKVVRP